MSDVTLVAKTRVKFGGEGHMDRNLGFVRTKEPTTVEPGKEFSIDSDTAEELIAAGAAMSKADYAAEERASKTAEDRLAEFRASLTKEGQDPDRAAAREKAKTGDSIAINSNAHIASQEREDAAIEEAQKKGKKGAKDKDSEGDDKTGKK